MKILMIAPEPFFEPRGTPFSEYYRLQALSALGHQVDLVTYPIGEDRPMPGLRIIRTFRPPGIRAVKTGPSAVKLVLDFFLFARAIGRGLCRHYDLVHTHEEGCLPGMIVARLKGIPHLYDMHSSLVQQLDNFEFSRSALVRGVFGWLERTTLRSASSVIVICRSLFDHARTLTDERKITLIENFMEDRPVLDPSRTERVRGEVGGAGRKVILYAGTLEAYQGIPLLLESVRLLPPEFLLVIVGGKPSQVEATRRQAEALGVAERVCLTGQKPQADIPYYMAVADVLVSPRSAGTNIPLKIYSYLRSGIPVVATDLPTHTQTLTRDISLLAEPRAEPFAAAIVAAAGEEGKRVGGAAVRFCAERYAPERYRSLVAQALERAISA